MGSALSIRYTAASGSETSPSLANNTPRVVVVAKRANSTPNIINDLNASPSNNSSSNTTSNQQPNTSPISPNNKNQYKIPKYGTTTAVIRTRGGNNTPIMLNENNYTSIDDNNDDDLSIVSNPQLSVTTTTSTTTTTNTSRNLKIQVHDSSISSIRHITRTPSPDNTTDVLCSPTSQSGVQPFEQEQCVSMNIPNPQSIEPSNTLATFSTMNHSHSVQGFNQMSSPRNNISKSSPSSKAHSPNLLPFQHDIFPLPSIDRVSTPNRYRHITFNSNRRASMSKESIVPVAIAENTGVTSSWETTNSFSSLSQWGGINEENILPETQKMNDYNKELKKQVKPAYSPDDLSKLEIGEDNNDLLLQMLLYNPIATIITDLDGNIIVMNDPFKQIFRVEEQSNVNNISSFIPRDYRKYHEKIMKKYKKTRQKLKRVTLGLTQYGEKIPIAITITTSVLGTSGKSVYICFVKDLTSEFKLNTLDGMYQNVTGLSSIPIVGIDQDCKITLFNQAAEETWMISKTEVIENNVKILMPVAEGKMHDRFVCDYILGKRENTIIDRVKQVTGRRVGNGKEFPLEIKVAEVKHELNNKRSFVAFLRDLTAVMTAREFQLTLYPEKVVNMLESGEKTIHHYHTCASVLFCDIVGFTEISRQMESNELVTLLDEIISMFDSHLLNKFRIEKIKTMGDNYMCATGLDDSIDHANNIVEAAIEMQKLMHEFNEKHSEFRERFPDHCNEYGQVISVRVGVNSGDLVAGIVGNRKPVYDVFGDNVNLASRMESSGIESQVQITPTTFNLLRDDLKLYFTLRKDNKVKGIGIMDTYITKLTPESFKSRKINYRNHQIQNSSFPNMGDIDAQCSLNSSACEDLDDLDH